MADRPRIIFFGTPDFAVPVLERLLGSEVDIAAVYTRPERPSGRRRKRSPASVKIYALEQGLKVLEPETLKDDAEYEGFASLAPDVCILAAYGKLIPKRFLDVPRFGFVNVHPSLLPRWRGPSPVQAAILNGDDKTGVSIMLMDEEMDHGPLLAQTEIPLDHTEYRPELQERLFRMGAALLVDTLSKHLLDGIPPVAQDHEKATFSEKTNRHAARIDWHLPAVQIERMVRAYAGEPVAWTTWQDRTVNIHKAKAHRHQEPQTKPGTILGYENEILADTPDGALELLEIQPAGKKPMHPRDFLNGHPDLLGSRFE